jgi:hypothetical protein
MGHLSNAGDKNELADLFRTRWTDEAWHEAPRLICAIANDAHIFLEGSPPAHSWLSSRRFCQAL